MQRLSSIAAWAMPALWLLAGCSSIGNAPAPAKAQLLSLSPVAVELEDNHVLVRAVLNGRDVRLLLDTGASWVLIKPEVAAAAGIQPGGNVRFGAFGSGRVSSRRGVAGSVAVGPAVAEQVPLVIVSMSLPFEADGLLGLTFLTRFTFRLDYEQKLISFVLPGDTNLAAGGSSIPLRTGGLCVVPAEVDGRPAKLIVDTGLDRALVLNSWFVEQERLRERYPNRLNMVSGIGLLGPMRNEITRVQTLKLGDYTVTNLLADFEIETNATEGIAGFVGAEVLRRFHLTFDPAGRRLWIEPNADFGRKGAPSAAVRSGFICLPQGTNWVVEDVVADSPAAEAGLRRGDRLLEINGVPTQSLKFVDIRRAFQAEPGTPVRLRVRSGGQAEREAILVLRDLL